MTPEHFNQPTDFSEGDLFYTVEDGRYHLYKLLQFDAGFDCYHVLIYEPVAALPQIDNLDSLEVYIYHTPVDKNGFAGAVLLANAPVSAEDLIGYHEYLRQTRDPSDYIPLANEYFQDGLRLTDENRHAEAIDAYSKAADLVPQFFEAIDNRAFCKMDLALWNEAIEDFRHSLEVNPVSMLAEFSIGECYLRLGNYPKAKEQFEKAMTIDPAHPLPKEFLEKVNQLLQ